MFTGRNDTREDHVRRSPRARSRRTAGFFALSVVASVLAACGDDTGPPISATDTFGADLEDGGDPGPDADDGDDEMREPDLGGADTTAGDDDGGEEDGGCTPGEAEYPIVDAGDFDPVRENDGEPVIQLDPPNTESADMCPLWTVEQGASAPGGANTRFHVYRPGDTSTMDGWPAARLPLVIFAPPDGGGVTPDEDFETHNYAHVFDQLARDGFIIVGIGGTSPNSGPKYNAMHCALEWATTIWEERDRLNCDLVAMGHSAGGLSAEMLAHDLATDVEAPVRLRAVVGIAPVPGADFDPDPADAVPYLLLQGPNDTDANASGNLVFDAVYREDPPSPSEPLPAADKVILWPYGVNHFDWGGQATNVNARGRAIAGAYIPYFLRYAVYGEQALRRWFVDLLHYQADATAFPEEIAGEAVLEDFWASFYENAAYSVLGERPVMFGAFSQGVAAEATRFPIDTMWRYDAPATCEDSGHVNALTISTSGFDAGTLGDLDSDGHICIGPSDVHADTERLRLAWGAAGNEPGVGEADGVIWYVVDDLSPYSALSVRASKQGGGATPARMVVEVETESAASPQPVRAELHYDRLVPTPSLPSPQRTLMHTVRFPFADICAEEVDVSQVRSISIRGDDDPQPAGAGLNLDSLELTSHPEDADLACSSPSAWRCEATTTLVATETSCDGEPTSSACDSLDVVTTPVDLPYVDIGTGWDGWAVWAPPGWVVDPQSPTQTELDRVLARCVTACMQEYAGSPHVAANCDAQGAFETPEPVAIPGAMGTRLSIPDAYRDGSGVEEGESLACDLLDSCCAELDEDVCPAAPRRVTVAQTQLGRGQEHVAAVAGTLTVLSPDDRTQAEADVAGTVGWSACPASESEPTVHCPFYLGSAHLETTEPLTLDLFCDGQWVERDLDALEIDLQQPALGIDLETGAWKGFPPGALVLTAAVEAGLVSLQTTEANAQPVEVEAYPGYIAAMPAPPGGFKVEFRIWCDGEIKPIEAYFGFEATEALHGPPTLGIEHLPDTIECPDELALTLAWGTDPEEDYASLRWVVDGVLLDDSLSTIPFTESHEVTAILRDVRGATGSATKSIACE